MFWAPRPAPVWVARGPPALGSCRIPTLRLLLAFDACVTPPEPGARRLSIHGGAYAEMSHLPFTRAVARAPGGGGRWGRCRAEHFYGTNGSWRRAVRNLLAPGPTIGVRRAREILPASAVAPRLLPLDDLVADVRHRRHPRLGHLGRAVHQPHPHFPAGPVVPIEAPCARPPPTGADAG